MYGMCKNIKNYYHKNLNVNVNVNVNKIMFSIIYINYLYKKLKINNNFCDR